MRGSVVLVAVVAACLAPTLAAADRVESKDRGKLEGTLQEATLVVDGVPRIYPGSDVETIELSEGGKDRITLRNGTKAEGKLATVAFKSGARLYVFSRSKLIAVALDAAGAAETERPSTKPAASPGPAPEQTAAQKKALARNEELYEAYSAKVTERRNKEAGALKSKHRGPWDQLTRKIQALERRIKNRPRGKKGASSRRIEADERTLKQAERKRAKLQETIAADVAAADERAHRKRRLVASVAKAIQGEILAGDLPTEGQMIVRYDAALAGRLMGLQPRKIVIRTMESGVQVRVGKDKDRPELIVDPFPEEGE